MQKFKPINLENQVIMVHPLIQYSKCTKTNAKIAGLSISDFFGASKKQFILKLKMIYWMNWHY